MTNPFYYSTPEGQNNTITQLLSNVDPIVYGNTTIPKFLWMNSSAAIVDQLRQQKEYATDVLSSSRCSSCPDASFAFNAVDTNQPKLDYTLMVDLQMGHHPSQVKLLVANFINVAFLKMFKNETEISVYDKNMPYISKAPTVDIGSFSLTLLLPFATSFLLPVYMFSIVLEKQEKLREMMRMMGLNMKWYWLVNYAYDIIMYTLVMIGLVAVALVFQLRFFTQTNWGVLIILFFGWGHVLIGMSIFLSAFFSKTRPATVVGYLLVIGSVIISYVVNLVVFPATELPNVFYLLYPPFAYYRLIFIMGTNCGLFQCYGWNSLFRANDSEPLPQLTIILMMIYAEAVVLFVAGGYLDAVLPRENGVVEHPLFFLFPVWAFLVKLFPVLGGVRFPSCKNLLTSMKFWKKQETNLLDREQNESLIEFQEDEAVNLHRDMILSNQTPPNCPIITRDLRKVYAAPGIGDSEKVALKGLYMCVESNECFGLLGPNGAGKTTTISILTGLFPATSGSAHIAGFDLSTDIDQVRRIVSVCPQFDTFWDLLTVKETLLFYARLKGVSPKEEDQHVDETISGVGLSKFKDRLSQDLSGGMKRRLSIGIALIGSPVLVFFDEPTTGLDPETKQNIWELLLQVKAKGNSMILTTHSMEEADVLCDRIAIMSLGEMKCIGTPLQLKKKFGKGYSLHLNFHPHMEEQVMKFVEGFIPTAELLEKYGGSCTYQIMQLNVPISQLFVEFEGRKDELGIVDWGINQTSLEDVFLNVAITGDEEITD
eukprot:TRINITY_DN2721_c0_g1_i1.p1 TRINITY_DN2721_c0_g1~~TRINITY_DN2721_c0_g1_i1.p1  ORF type:complete len:858 (+),score=273.16 TRINITY_DN2721_c0_g1_i1:275-2575(+)